MSCAGQPRSRLLLNLAEVLTDLTQSVDIIFINQEVFNHRRTLDLTLSLAINCQTLSFEGQRVCLAAVWTIVRIHFSPSLLAVLEWP